MKRYKLCLVPDLATVALLCCSPPAIPSAVVRDVDHGPGERHVPLCEYVMLRRRLDRTNLNSNQLKREPWTSFSAKTFKRRV
ncbi:hypothetical protein C0J52_02809 [Blattella germanica]|nr:hypothetical protein C0J52_02809 [Blattella germanica]